MRKVKVPPGTWAGQLITSFGTAIAWGHGEGWWRVLMGANGATMAADVDHYCVVNDAVDDGADHHLVGEDQAAVREAAQFRGQHDGSSHRRSPSRPLVVEQQPNLNDLAELALPVADDRPRQHSQVRGVPWRARALGNR